MCEFIVNGVTKESWAGTYFYNKTVCSSDKIEKERQTRRPVGHAHSLQSEFPNKVLAN